MADAPSGSRLARRHGLTLAGPCDKFNQPTNTASVDKGVSHGCAYPPRKIGSRSACGPCPGRAAIRSVTPPGPRSIPIEAIEKLAEAGAWGVTFHDDDLIPFGSDAATRDKLIAGFNDACAEQQHHHRDGHHQPVHPPGVQGRRLHLQRPLGAPVRAAQGAAQRRPDRGTRRQDLRHVGRPGGQRVRRIQGPERRLRPLPRGRRHRRRLHQGQGLRHQDRARAQAERAARRHPAADRRACARASSPSWSTATSSG